MKTIDPAPSETTQLRFRILGPLHVSQNGRAINLGPQKQQLVLAVLLCNANSHVTVDSLVESVWDDQPPRIPRKNLQVYICGLRGLLGATPDSPRITYRANGYVLSAGADELDWLRFEQKVFTGRQLWDRAGPPAAGETLGEALQLWRGPVLDGMRGALAIDEAAAQLESRFLTVFEDWAESQIAIGVSPNAVEKISAIAEQHPFRERLRVAQMTALNHIGRRTEALAIFDDLRRSLASEFGLAPSPVLEELHRSLLRGEEPAQARQTTWVIRRPAGGCPLPRDITAFTGREEEISEIEQALSGTGERNVVISGPSGVGKTALAVHLVHRLHDRYPDGCCFVRLRREDGTLRPPAEVTSELMWAVGIPETDGHVDMTGTWRRWLAGSRALVVLDGARGEADVRPFIPEAGESALIITARTRLAGLGWAHRLAVPMFKTGDALTLLRRIIGDRRVDSDQPAALRIIKAVGRLPLAVRIIGDKLAGLDHVPLNEFLVRMQSAPSVLDELAVGDVGVRARLAAAIGDLPPQACCALRRLASLPHDCFTLSEAATALEVDEDTAVRTLESLLETSIIDVPDAETTAHDVVYEMPVLTHAYAREISISSMLSGSAGPGPA